MSVAGTGVVGVADADETVAVDVRVGVAISVPVAVEIGVFVRVAVEVFATVAVRVFVGVIVEVGEPIGVGVLRCKANSLSTDELVFREGLFTNALSPTIANSAAIR